MRVRPFRRVGSVIAMLYGLTGAAVGCTSSVTVEVSTTSTVTRTPTPGGAGPLSTATVRERATSTCPYISAQRAADIVGYRLDKVTTLVQATRVVGCRFYALQHPTSQCDQACVDHERLPPADVPGVEIVATRYRSPLDAHNAFVRTTEAGSDFQSVQIEPGNAGVCYRTTVWVEDNGTDWACAFSKGATAVVVRTVVTDPAFTVAELARAVAPRF